MTEDGYRLIGKVDFHADADYHDVSRVAEAIAERGYDVGHVINPQEDEPFLYIEQEVEGE